MLAMRGFQKHSVGLSGKNMSGYDEKDDSEHAVLDTLQMRILGIAFKDWLVLREDV